MFLKARQHEIKDDEDLPINLPGNWLNIVFSWRIQWTPFFLLVFSSSFRGFSFSLMNTEEQFLRIR